MKTYYVLQEFEMVKKRWSPKQPREVQSAEIAKRAVKRFEAQKIPALAFTRSGDPDTGDFTEAEIIASFDVPPEFMGETADW